MRAKYFTFLGMLAGVCFASALSAQTLSIGYVYPAGGCAGTTFEVEIGGQNLKDVVGIVVSGELITAEITSNMEELKKVKRKRDNREDANLQIADRIKVRMTIDRKAELGMRDLRLKTQKGYSNRLFFEVGQLPDVLENRSNNVFEKASPVPFLPATLNGQVMPGTKDFFRFSAVKGQTLVFYVKARSFVPFLADAVPGWFQPVLTLYTKEGREVAFNDDNFFRPDPCLVYTVKESDDYVLQINDAIFRGREDFLYRIDAGEIPYLESIYPLGGKRGKRTKVELKGVNLSSSTLKVKPQGKDPERIEVRAKGTNGLLSNPVEYAVSNASELFEKPDARWKTDEAKSMARMDEKAIDLAKGEVFNGILRSETDEDWFRVQVDGKKPVVFAVQARQLGSPLDGKLTIYDAQGRKIAEEDDTPNRSEGMETHHADPSLVFKAPKPGSYFVRLTDAQNKGGEDYAYRLRIDDVKPEFDLRISPSNLSIPKGGTANLSVSIIRKNKFNGEVDIFAKGLPSGFKLSKSRMSRGESQLRMTITAPENIAEGPIDFQLWGQATTEDGEEIVKQAFPAEEMLQAFYIRHLIPTSDFRVSITPELPYSIELLTDVSKPIQLSLNKGTEIKVRVIRKETFKEPITIMMGRGSNGLEMVPVVLEPDQTDAVVLLEVKRGGFRETEQIVNLNAIVRPTNSNGGQSAFARRTFNTAYTAFSPAFSVRIPIDAERMRKNKENNENKK